MLPQAVNLTRSYWLSVHDDGQGIARIRAVIDFLQHPVDEQCDALQWRLPRMGEKPLHDDIGDALACALVAHLFAGSPEVMEPVPQMVPSGEGWIMLPGRDG